ncbi:hypothetical protein [Streptomyces yaizuensis]|uniref:Uncharacterized protein n=1 Tax=Streptomyces yaizuensis TaxID=2989713 RepID=A0ABQ5PBG4_9ACTN|nr:hypothetical protein [Streptomyces sp. YSPA8]GLF99926.1 hypothetical protein SYYSPA8_36535 [Streptomyces sp. YSPA8]
MVKSPHSTDISNADKIITTALAYGLTVTVNTAADHTLTRQTVRISIPVPTAHSGTDLGRAIAGNVVEMFWTKNSTKGSRGRLQGATRWSVSGHRKLRTLRAAADSVRDLGHDSNRYAREAAPLPEDVVDAMHAVFVDGHQVHPGIPAAHVRTIVSSRRFRGWLVHQDNDGTIVSDDRRYVPLLTCPGR